MESEKKGNNPKVLLTKRQKEIIDLAAEQFSSKEIADRLGISTRTVEDHRKRLMKLMKVKNFAGVLSYYQTVLMKEQQAEVIEGAYEILHKMHADLTNTLNEAGSWRNALTLQRRS